MHKNPDGLSEDEIAEGLWKSQVMAIRARKQGRAGVSAMPFWNNMIDFAKDRRMTRKQLESVRQKHRDRDK